MYLKVDFIVALTSLYKYKKREFKGDTAVCKKYTVFAKDKVSNSSNVQSLSHV